MKKETSFKTVDEYIGLQPAKVRPCLEQIRSVIRATAPEAEESINYMMPAYKLYGKPLVYFGAFAKHCSLFALPSAQVKFEKELREYKTSKGTVQFPYDEPLPLKLIEKIVQFRVKENTMKQAQARGAKKKDSMT